jgi:predicted nucleotidyltransferase
MTSHPLSSSQRALIESLSERLARFAGIQAVVLGGSYARGQAQPGSDIDLGLLYREASPFSLDDVRELARQVNDTPEPVVAGFYQWGPWVNGGAWLTIGGQRVDFLYKNLDQLERVIEAAHAGRVDHDYNQHAPFGFYSDTFLSELETSVVLSDPGAILPPLKQRIAIYPERLRVRLVQESLGAASFDLYAAAKSAEVVDSYLTNACLLRAVNRLVHALFALNRRYRVNDKTAFAELAGAALMPRDFSARVQAMVSALGSERKSLLDAVAHARALLQEIAELEPALLAQAEDSPEWLKMLKRAGFS